MTSLNFLLGKRIKEIREAQNLKQVDLANLIDIEATNLSKIEKGIHFPKEENLKKIAKILKVDITDLFDFKHLKPKTDLMLKIHNILNNSSKEEVAFFYKILVSYKELNKK